jgi:hypothetical protein
MGQLAGHIIGMPLLLLGWALNVASRALITAAAWCLDREVVDDE